MGNAVRSDERSEVGNERSVCTCKSSKVWSSISGDESPVKFKQVW